MAYYTNLQEVENTQHEVYIYQIADSVKGAWYVRIKRHNANGYFRKSLKTRSIFEAKKRALQYWMQVRDAESQDIVLAPSTSFKLLANKWLKEIETTRKSTASISSVQYQFRNYFLPYFGNDSVEHINDRRYRDFIKEHRLPHAARKAPKLSTLTVEQSNFNSFLTWCYDHGYTKRKIRISNIRHAAGRWMLDGDKMDIGSKKRTELATFEVYGYFRDYFSKVNPWSHPRQKNEPFHVLVNRKRAAFYMMTLYNLTCRPGAELLQAKWGDLTRHASQEREGAFYMSLTVRHGKKVNKSDFDGVNTLTYCSDYRYIEMLARWRKFLQTMGFPTGPDDYLFPLKKGRADKIGRRMRAKRNQQEEYYTHWDSVAAGAFMKRSRPKVLEWRKNKNPVSADLEEQIMAFTWYSVRHVAIKQMLTVSKFPIHYVAEKANTGISMIEDFYAAYIHNPEERIISRAPRLSDDKREIQVFKDDELSILDDL